MGDGCSIISTLTPQFTVDQVQAAFNWALQAYNDANNEYTQMVQWLDQNSRSLTPEGLQLYQSGLADKTEVVNELMNVASQLGAAVNCMGGNASFPGILNGYLGIGWVAAVGIGVGIIAVLGVIGFSIEYAKALDDQALAKIEQAKAMTVAQQNVPALVAAGWTPDQINAYLKQQQDANKPSVLDQIPWKTIAVAGVGVVLIKGLFG